MAQQTRLQRLIFSARASAEYRGHVLGKFRPLDANRQPIRYESTCHRCGMAVVVNRKPLPNEISVAGPAVAVHCAHKEE